MNKATIVLLLIIAVIGIFLFKPDLLGLGTNGSAPLAVAPSTSEPVQEVQTMVDCMTINECIAAAADYGVPEGIESKCVENKCVFILGGGSS